MDEREARVVRAWIVDRLTHFTDNHDQRYEEVRRAARHAVLEDTGTGDSRAQFLEALRTGDLLPYADAIGARVSDLIHEWVAHDITDEGTRTLVLDVLDLTDSQQRALLGEHYMPEADDFGPVAGHPRETKGRQGK